MRKGGRKGRASALPVEWRWGRGAGRGLGLCERPGDPAACWEGERAAESRVPRPLRVSLGFEFPLKFGPRRGAAPTPPPLGKDTRGPGEKAQSRGRGKNRPGELLGPAPPALPGRWSGRCAQGPGWRGASVRAKERRR